MYYALCTIRYKVTKKIPQPQPKSQKSSFAGTALSFKISHTIPKYPYFIGDILPMYSRKVSVPATMAR
jgi:hypothetical protein